MRWIAVGAVALLGCAGSEGDVVADASVADTAVVETAAVDSRPVEPIVDSAEPDVSVVIDAAETSTCAYVAVDDVVVRCGDKYKMLGYFNVVPAAASCPPFWAFAGKSPHATKEDAIAAEGCSASCIYTFFQAITRLYCGKKSGYEVLRAMDCADLYRFPEGYFPSVEAHDAAHPCPG